MDITLFPTKSNLMLAKNSLRLSKQGYELLDKKRNVLIREMMELIDRAKSVQAKIDSTFFDAYSALMTANIVMSINSVEQISGSVDIDDTIKITSRSVMGVEIPHVTTDRNSADIKYGTYRTSTSLDKAYKAFFEVKMLCIELAEVESSVSRLAVSIKKTQKRANALKNIMIPRYEQITKDIQSALEEKEREDFSRLKVIKKMKL